MPREQFNVQLEPDYAEAIKDFAEDRGLSKSVAVRRLIVEGLRAQDYIDTEQQNQSKAERVQRAKLVLYIIAYLATCAIIGGILFEMGIL